MYIEYGMLFCGMIIVNCEVWWWIKTIENEKFECLTWQLKNDYATIMHNYEISTYEHQVLTLFLSSLPVWLMTNEPEICLNLFVAFHARKEFRCHFQVFNWIEILLDFWFKSTVKFIRLAPIWQLWNSLLNSFICKIKVEVSKFFRCVSCWGSTM